MPVYRHRGKNAPDPVYSHYLEKRMDKRAPAIVRGFYFIGNAEQLGIFPVESYLHMRMDPVITENMKGLLAYRIDMRRNEG